MFSNSASNEKYKAIVDLFSTVGIIDHKNWKTFSDIIKKLSPDEKRALFDILAIKFNDKLNEIKTSFATKSPDIFTSINQMISDKNPEIFFIASMMVPFVYGYGFLRYESGILTCAQVAARKNSPNKLGAYIFNPTILNSKEELKKYLQITKDRGVNQDVRERFVFASFHWLTFDVQISNGKASIFVIESFGKEKQHHSTADIAGVVASVFPNAPIYFSNNQRQHTEMGCAVFALDDIIHLSTLENYLQEKNLFQYFISQNQKPEPLSQWCSVQVIPVELPLSLMRTKQHADLRTTVIPSRVKEKELPVNKKNQTALESVNLSFKPRADNPAKELNLRLDEQLDKMAINNLTFLVNHSIDELIQATSQHTLEGFQQRVLQAGQDVHNVVTTSHQKP